MSLNEMPDDVLIRLLNTAAPQDVVRVKQLNKRFNRLVDTYNLGKPRVKEFCIESRLVPNASSSSPHKIGRLRLAPSGIQKRRVVVTMRKERGVKKVERLEDPSCSTATNQFVQETMKKVVLDEKFSFDGVTIDEEFYKILMAKNNNMRHVTTLALSLCHIRISANQWIELLSRMTVKHLYVDFCTFDPSLFSDKVMMSLEHLETLQIQPRFPCFLNETSDQTLIYWATRGTVPPTVLLRNGCASRITPDGIRMLITSALASQASAKLDWDFGLLLGTTQFDAALLTFILYPGWQVKVSDDFRSRKIQVQKESTVTQFSLPVPFPMGSLSVPLNS
uniref:F-box domain-containing protein n=1 Tax=Caenorhabditis japonica TaxID=281687 RepID=A0A8R1DUN8_CAEJA